MQALKDEIEELKSQKAAVDANSHSDEEEKNKQAERVKALEESIRKHRDQLTKTHNEFRLRWANATSEKKTMEAEKQVLENTVSDLRNQIQVLTTDLGGQLDILRREKATLEQSLEVEKIAKGPNLGSGQDSIIVSNSFLVK